MSTLSLPCTVQLCLLVLFIKEYAYLNLLSETYLVKMKFIRNSTITIIIVRVTDK